MIVDASVLAKLFCSEAYSDRARELIGAAGDSIRMPAHGPAELAEVLNRKVALGDITAEQCDSALVVSAQMIRSEPLERLLQPACLIAREIGASVYDSLYVALAEIGADTLLTWDQRLLRLTWRTRLWSLMQPLDPQWTR